MSKYGLRMEGKWPKIEKLRKKDISIMDEIYKSDITDSELAACNRCRIYLQVVWVSEVTTGDGRLVEDRFDNV